MVVVVIIGILAAIAIPTFISMEFKAKEAAVRSNMHTIDVTLEDYATTYGSIYPTSLSDTNFLQLLPDQVMPNNPYSTGNSMGVIANNNVNDPVTYAAGHTGCSGASTEGEVSYYYSPSTSPTHWALNGCNDTGTICAPGYNPCGTVPGTNFVVHN